MFSTEQTKFNFVLSLILYWRKVASCSNKY